MDNQEGVGMKALRAESPACLSLNKHAGQGTILAGAQNKNRQSGI